MCKWSMIPLYFHKIGVIIKFVLRKFIIIFMEVRIIKLYGRQLRNELKFVIGQGEYTLLRSRANAIMSRDKNALEDGSYRVTSLYFDDIYSTSYFQKLESIQSRAKFRIRCYNGLDNVISLECKLKYDNYISKESVKLTTDQYKSILAGDYDFALSSGNPLLLELYKQHTTKGLSPCVSVDYVREAFVCREGNVRLTFDKELSGSISGLDILYGDVVYTSAMPSGLMVLELKYDDYLPAHIKAITSGLPLTLQPVSKFILCKNKQLEASHYGKNNRSAK